MMLEKEDKEKAEESGALTPVRTDESTSSITVDPTTLDEREESELKEAIQKAMLDEKGQDKGYFTIEDVPMTKWTESKVERVIQEWYDSGRLMERQGIGKYAPV
jgi:hypothetical protein